MTQIHHCFNCFINAQKQIKLIIHLFFYPFYRIKNIHLFNQKCYHLHRYFKSILTFFIHIINRQMEERSQISNIIGSLKCKGGKPIKFLCQQQSCNNQPFMCASQDCQCYIQHGQCTAIIQYKGLAKGLESNKKIDKNYIELLDEEIRIIDQMIDKLSEERNKIQQQKEWCGISRRGRMFLQYARDNQIQKITSSMIKQVFNEVKMQQNQPIVFLSKDKIKQEWQKSTKKLFEQLIQKTKVWQRKKLFTNSDIIVMEEHEVRLCDKFKGRNVKRTEKLYDCKEFEFKQIIDCRDNQDTLIVMKTHTKKIIAIYIPFKWSQYRQDRWKSIIKPPISFKPMKNIQTHFASDNRTKVLISFSFRVTLQNLFMCRRRMINYIINNQLEYTLLFLHKHFIKGILPLLFKCTSFTLISEQFSYLIIQPQFFEIQNIHY